MAQTHDDRVTALADAMGVNDDQVVPILKRNKAALPTHDKNGVPLFWDSDGADTDEAIVLAAYANIEAIRKGTGR